MARYKIILVYDGTELCGSQRQANTRTVQGDLEAALRKLGWQGPSVLLAGRTDSGVHASGQVSAFDLDWKHPSGALLRALNALLPPDLAVRSISECPPDFHPRFQAISRSYCYAIFCDPNPHPLRERYAWRVWPEPDFDLLRNCAQEFVGQHDFAVFGSPTRVGGSTTREVQQACWQQKENGLTFEVTANAFLYHMVRRMVFAQVAVAQGRLEAGIISRALEQPQARSMFQGLAPPQGLTLVGVAYPPEIARRL